MGADQQALGSIEKYAVQFVERIGLLQPELLAPLLHEEFVLRTMFRSQRLPLRDRISREEFLGFLVDARTIFPNKCPHRVVSVISSGDHVVVESECLSVMNDGQKYNNQFSFHFLFTGNEIREVREYTDFLHTYEAVFSGLL